MFLNMKSFSMPFFDLVTCFLGYDGTLVLVLTLNVDYDCRVISVCRIELF